MLQDAAKLGQGVCRELCMNYRYPEFYKVLNETCAANGRRARRTDRHVTAKKANLARGQTRTSEPDGFSQDSI